MPIRNVNLTAVGYGVRVDFQSTLRALRKSTGLHSSSEARQYGRAARGAGRRDRIDATAGRSDGGGPRQTVDGSDQAAFEILSTLIRSAVFIAWARS